MRSSVITLLKSYERVAFVSPSLRVCSKRGIDRQTLRALVYLKLLGVWAFSVRILYHDRCSILPPISRHVFGTKYVAKIVGTEIGSVYSVFCQTWVLSIQL